MTTLAYRDGIIAYDSRLTSYDTIVSDDFEKKISVNKVVFIFSGAAADYDDFIDVYFGKKSTYKIGCSAFVYDNKKLYRCGIDGESSLSWKLLVTEYASAGSGASNALTAMDMGADAKLAVKMAMKRDTATGGRIRTFKMDDCTKP